MPCAFANRSRGGELQPSSRSPARACRPRLAARDRLARAAESRLGHELPDHLLGVGAFAPPIGDSAVAQRTAPSPRSWCRIGRPHSSPHARDPSRRLGASSKRRDRRRPGGVDRPRAGARRAGAVEGRRRRSATSRAPLHDGERVEIVTPNSDDWDSVQLIRHDTAHVLAAAVLELYPGTKISIGPPIGEGFYYDFEFPDGVTVSDADFEAIEAKMREHVKADEPFVREDVSVGDALERFVREDQDYKVELIEDLVARPGRRDGVAVHQRRVHRPLPRPAHAVDQAGEGVQAAVGRRRVLARRLRTARCSRASTAPPSTPRTTSSSTCTSSRRPARATTAGSAATSTCSCSASSAPARRSGCRTARRCSTSSRTSGARRTARAATARSRRRSSTTSACGSSPGHWDVYRDHMYFTDVEGHPMGLKPMNCPAHVQLFKDERRSYRDLPIRYSEAGLVHRHEPSGTLHGLLRVRHITQDDAHIFCHRGADPRGGPALPGLRLRDLRHLRLQAAARALDAARQARRHRGDVGPRRGVAREGAGRQGRRVRAQPRRRRVLRAEDRPPHDRLDRPLVAARHGPARLLHARAVRARPTPAPTTPTTGR